MRKRLTRLLDRVAPVRPQGEDRGYRRILRWAALPVTDRRWAAPLAAAALGFGLFVGVAIGPGTSGTLATGAAPVIELPGLLSAGGDGGGEEPLAAGGGEAESFPEGGGEEAELAFPEEEASSSAFESLPETEEPIEEPAGEAAPTGEEEPAAETETEERAQTLAGTVVHANPAAGSYTLVEAGGLMNAIHAAKLPAPGTKVSVPVRTLANGTYAEEGKRKQTGAKAGATIAGVVTFVSTDPAAPAYAVSKRGVSVLVRVRPDPSGAAPVLPQLGAYAIAKVEIEKVPAAGTAPSGSTTTLAPPPGAAPAAPPAVSSPADPAVAPTTPTCAADPAQPLTVPAPTAVLWQSSVDADGAPFASSDFAGVVTAVCASEAKLAISGDDLRQAGADLVFTVPPTIGIADLKVGDSVVTTAKIESGGALSLTGLADDERSKGADDAAAAQGDLASHKPR